jgi:hypothetical protein
VKFHVFVLQVNGDVTARQEADSQKAQSNPTARHLIQEFSALLTERFAGNPEKRGKFQFPTDESARYRWKWDQFNPLSARCVMEVAGKPISVCVGEPAYHAVNEAVEKLDKRGKYQRSRKVDPVWDMRN